MSVQANEYRATTRTEQEAIVIGVRPYADDIYAYNLQLTKVSTPEECVHIAQPVVVSFYTPLTLVGTSLICSYMRRQLEIQDEHRGILIDWLIDVCNEYTMDQVHRGLL